MPLRDKNQPFGRLGLVVRFVRIAVIRPLLGWGFEMLESDH
jgi:hypothetical protein